MKDQENNIALGSLAEVFVEKFGEEAVFESANGEADEKRNKKRKEKDSIVKDDTRVAERDKIFQLSVDKIKINIENPMVFDPNSADYKALVESIDSLGIIVALIVRLVNGTYMILSGERRFRAAIDLGHKTVPVQIVICDDATAKRIMLASNSQRDISVREMIRSAKMEREVWDEDEDKLSAYLAKKYKRSIRTIQRYLRIAVKIPEFIDLIGTGISENAANTVMKMRDQIDYKKLIEAIRDVEKPLSSDEIIELIDMDYVLYPFGSPFEKEKMHIVKLSDDDVAMILGRDYTRKDLRTLRERILKLAKKARDVCSSM